MFDVAASESGALAVLMDFYRYVLINSDESIEWYFVVSSRKIIDIEINRPNIHVLFYPRVKDNWLKRIYFELFVAPSIAKSHNADAIFSLQNIAMIGGRLPQVIYVHQTLPYGNNRFSLINTYERFLAIYAKIFRVLIGWSVKKASVVIVQTSWLKKALVKYHSINSNKVFVIPPALDINIPSQTVSRDYSSFFYPTTPFPYKNIELIISAVAILKKEGFSPKVILTINGKENNYSRHLCSLIEKAGLNDCFSLIGTIPRVEVFKLYRSATLLFTSKLESFGLPLLEARTVGAAIIATGTPFAHEILSGYPNVSFCDLENVESCANAIRNILRDNSTRSTIPNSYKASLLKTTEKWNEVVEIIVNAKYSCDKGK